MYKNDVSTILEIGANKTIISIGKPAEANNAVAVMVAVPGTPTVPIDTTTAKTIKNIYDNSVSFENLLKAHKKARCGKREKKKIILFELKLE